MVRMIYLFIVLLFMSGCAKTTVEYVPQIVVKEVPVPVYFEIPPVECYLKGKDEEEILNNMLKCIVDQKRVLDILREKAKRSKNGKK